MNGAGRPEWAKGVTIAFDMDGVIAKWQEKATQEQVAATGYFISLEEEARVKEFVFFLLSLGFKLIFLSAVFVDDHSAREKGKWLDNRGLPESLVPRCFVPYGEDKNKYVGEDKNIILIDDFGKNLEAWRASGRRAIKFYNGINNRPKMEFDENGTARIQLDSWNGPSISKDMSVEDMYAVLIGQIALLNLTNWS